MKKARSLPPKDYLKRCKYSSPESKLEWLESAVEFAFAKKRRFILRKAQ